MCSLSYECMCSRELASMHMNATPVKQKITRTIIITVVNLSSSCAPLYFYFHLAVVLSLRVARFFSL